MRMLQSNRYNSFDNMQVLIFCELGLRTPIHALKIGGFGRKIGEGMVRCWSATNSFLLLGVVTSVPLLAKIDQEMRPWECGQTDGHTHWQRQTEFIICPMLYAIAMGR